MIPLLVIGLLLLGGIGLLFWRLSPNRHGAIALAMLALSLPLYALTGSPGELDAIHQTRAAQAALRSEIHSLATKLQQQPSDLEGWALLGQKLAEAQQFDKSAEAFKQSVLLSRGNPQLMLAYGKSLVLAAGGEVTDPAKEALKMVLMLIPGQPDALYFTGLGKVQQGDFVAGLTLWEQARDGLPAKSPQRRHIEEKIAALKARM